MAITHAFDGVGRRVVTDDWDDDHTIDDGTIAAAKLAATGTPSSSTFLRGDDTWATPAGASGSEFGHVLNPGDSIQSAIAAGHKLILLNAGEYTTSSVIQLDAAARGTRIVGAGQQTRLRCTAGTNLAAFVKVGDGAVDGVQIEALVIDCDSNADVGLDVNSNGTSGFYQSEPDSVHRFRNLWVYDADVTGVHARGTDTQATEFNQIRIRRAGTTGFLSQGPDNWITNVEATTQAAGGAGFHINSANTFVHGCKAWFCRGYGFHVEGTRNTFTNCHSQDTADHGWFVDWDKNTIVNCIADSAAYQPVGGTLNGADGFYVSGNLPATTIQGCMGFDRGQGAPLQQRYGINAPAAMFSADANGMVRIAGFVGYDNATALVNQR